MGSTLNYISSESILKQKCCASNVFWKIVIFFLLLNFLSLLNSWKSLSYPDNILVRKHNKSVINNSIRRKERPRQWNGKFSFSEFWLSALRNSRWWGSYFHFNLKMIIPYSSTSFGDRKNLQSRMLSNLFCITPWNERCWIRSTSVRGGLHLVKRILSRQKTKWKEIEHFRVA